MNFFTVHIFLFNCHFIII